MRNELPCLSVREVHIRVLAMGAAEHWVQLIEGSSPLFLFNLFFEFLLAFIAEPAIAIWGYPEFHFAFLPFKGIKYVFMVVQLQPSTLTSIRKKVSQFQFRHHGSSD
jgi:hypothetical protein